MKKYHKYYSSFLVVALLCCGSCRKTVDEVSKQSFFKGVFKAKEVKEGNTVVYRDGSTNNIIAGYANYRIVFSVTNATQNVKIIEYNGDTFNGVWSYNEATFTLTFSQLTPRPASGSYIFNVQSASADGLVLVNVTPNLKTGETINTYTLIPE